MDVENFKRLGLDVSIMDRPFDTTVNGRSNAEMVNFLAVPEDAQYNPCAEAFPGADVPRGDVLKVADWDQSQIFPDTQRDVWIYTPQQLQSQNAPELLVFNDGLAYADPAGPVRATAVLDTLIQTGDIAPTIAVFVMPGRVSAGAEDEANIKQRSLEYDSVTDTYVRFLIDELQPFVESETGQKATDDPRKRTICGISSGGICAFTAAWHAPDRFGRVLSHCGSFVNIRGGHNFPYLVNTTPRKPIKAFLQSGAWDANIVLGNWPLANKTMAAALEFAGYESRFVFGEGGHSLRHGGAIFAESLRWLLAPAVTSGRCAGHFPPTP